MMKKLSKLALLAVATALLLAGVTACSDDGDDFSQRVVLDMAKEMDGLGVKSLSEEVTFTREGIVSASVDGTMLTLTSEAPGTTIMTIKVSGEMAGKTYENVPVNVTLEVYDDGEIDWVSIDVTGIGTGNGGTGNGGDGNGGDGNGGNGNGDGWTWDAANEGYADGAVGEEGATSKDGNVNFTKNVNTKKNGNIQIPSRDVPTANDWATAEKIVYFTVPKGATKITVNLRTGSSSAGSNITVVSKSDLTKPVFQKNYEDNSKMKDYEDCEITFAALSADTVFYIFNNKQTQGEFVAGGSGGLNVKKISVK